MTDLVAMRDRPPRFVGGDNWARRLCIGFLIDWLDSRPEHAAHDTAQLQKTAARGDEVALAAAGLTNRLGRCPHAGELSFDSRTDHGLEYPAHSGVWYHAHIAGHMHDDELPLGSEVYSRLHAVAPECLSGLVNRSELERRRGNETHGRALLETALARASSSTAFRYDVQDRKWVLVIRCALARMARDAGDGRALLEHAQRERLADLIEQLRSYDGMDKATVAAHQAFSVASAEQRIVLHAAMRMLPIFVTPPPAAHERFDAVLAAERIVQEMAAKDARQDPPPPFRPTGVVSSAIWKLLQRFTRNS